LKKKINLYIDLILNLPLRKVSEKAEELS